MILNPSIGAAWSALATAIQPVASRRNVRAFHAPLPSFPRARFQSVFITSSQWYSVSTYVNHRRILHRLLTFFRVLGTGYPWSNALPACQQKALTYRRRQRVKNARGRELRPGGGNSTLRPVDSSSERTPRHWGKALIESLRQ